MEILLVNEDITVKKSELRRYLKEIIPVINYATHGLHSYTAKLIPYIPQYFIKKYTQEDDIVLDPFCGSGTTLLEARLLKRNSIGIDINPLAKLISEVKTTPFDVEKLNNAIDLVGKKLKKNGRGRISVDFPNKDYWFSKKAQNELTKIKHTIINLRDKVDPTIYKFLLLCFSSVIRKSSYADPRIAKTYKSMRVIEKIQNGWISKPIQYFEETIQKNFERIRSFSQILNSNSNTVEIFQGDARKTTSILKQNKVEEIDFIITSPPYINAQDYFRSYKLELWWLGLATPDEVRHLNKQAIGTENISGYNYNSPPKSQYRHLNTILNKIWKIDRRKAYIVFNYFENMNDVFRESCNVLKRGGHFCLITGNNTICEIKIPTYKILIQIGENNGFRLVEIDKDEIRNRSLPPNRNHNGGIIKEEWITVFRKVE